MSRDDGFTIADIDTRLLDDMKIRRLVRSTTDEGLLARCVVAYHAVLYASWHDGTRVTLEDAAPLWLSSLEALGARLTEAGLLDDQKRIPMAAWDSWYGVAFKRREERRAAGRKGGIAATQAKQSSTNGRA